MARISIAFLSNLFLRQVIAHFGDVMWSHSVDPTAPDFFFSDDNLKGKVHGSQPANLDQLKVNLRRNRPHCRRNSSGSDAELLNLFESVHSTGLWLSKAVVPRIDGTHKFMGMLQN
jgi:hypothetical protein